MSAKNQSDPHVRTYFLVAGSVGVFLSLLALFLLTLPRWKLLAQLSQFPLATRVLLLLELASPLLCLLVCAAWIEAIRWMGTLTAASGEQPGEAQKEEERSQIRTQQRPPTPVLPERAVAVPPFFQRDPTDPVPVSPFPRFPAAVSPLPAPPPAADPPVAQVGEERRCEQISLQPEGQPETPGQDPLPPSHEKRAEGQIQLAPAFVPLRQQEDPLAQRMLTSSALPDSAPPRPSPLVTLSLLGRMQVWLHAPGGLRKEVPLRRGEQGIRQIALAYVAWRQGAPVDRDKLLTHVFARGHRREFSVEQLGEAFDGVKRFLREDLRRAVRDLNTEQGDELISAKAVGFFLSEHGFYRLHPCCRVTDLETIEQLAKTIQLARQDGLLDGKPETLMPSWVLTACQQCLDAYTGDFLQELIDYFPEEFGSWVREPYTLYRDYYLEALWILASYESALGKQLADADLAAQQAGEQRGSHQSRAAHYFRTYAMHAINGRADNKLRFAYRAKDSKDGERVVMSERAIRRCIVELGKIGKTDQIDQIYLAYKEKMLAISEGQWKPKPETEADIASARKQTSAYRFSAQIALEEHSLHP